MWLVPPSGSLVPGDNRRADLAGDAPAAWGPLHPDTAKDPVSATTEGAQEMADDLKGMRVAILATDGVERIELEQPRGALYGAGAASDLLSTHTGEIQAPGSGGFSVRSMVLILFTDPPVPFVPWLAT